MEPHGERTTRVPEQAHFNGMSAHYLPWVILAIGLAVTVSAWRVIRAHEHAQLDWATKLAGEAVRSDIITDMEFQKVGLERLALLWEAADPPQALWISNAELYLQHRPGSVAVEWLTPSGEPRVLVTQNGHPNTPLAFDGVPKASLEEVRAAGATIISVPAPVSEGRRQWAIVHAVSVNGETRGFVVSFFDLQESLDYILSDVKGLGFSFAVSAPGQPEYLLPASNREHEQEWQQIVDVPLSGVTWQLHIWPTSSVVNVIQSRLADATLAAGIALSLLLALVLYLAIRTARSTAHTRQANRDLQHEISVRQGAEEELRRAHADLETRVDQRTSELAGANALLHREIAEHERAEATLRDLTTRLFRLQDEERRRLARELHDGAVQNLVALSMDVAMIRDAVPTEDVSSKELVNECVRLIEKSTTELRTISYLLHPPYFDELGLTAAVKDFVDGFRSRSGIQVTLHIDPELGRLGHDLELAIYRIIQEGLSNVHRHANSRTARIALERHANFVHLHIADAGRGIPPDILAAEGAKATGVGIAGIRERVRLLGGQLEIHSASTGTTIQAFFKVPAPDLHVKRSVDPSSESGVKDKAAPAA